MDTVTTFFLLGRLYSGSILVINDQTVYLGHLANYLGLQRLHDPQDGTVKLQVSLPFSFGRMQATVLVLDRELLAIRKVLNNIMNIKILV